MNAFPPVTELIAHRGEMLLIERVLAASAERIQVIATTDPNAWYADADGAMPAWIGVELMAQAVAAWAGMQTWDRAEKPKQGFLLGTRAYHSKQPSFAAGSELRVTAAEVFKESNGLAAFDCAIEYAGEIVAEAVLKVFEPADFAAFMEQGQ